MEYRGKSIDALRKDISKEIYKAVGLSTARWAHRPLRLLFRVPTHRFAQVGARFDHWVRHLGFAEAARRTLPRFISEYRAHGTEHIPREGPLLVTANHPGTYDALVIAACVDRDDIKIVSGDIAFLRALPFTKDHMLSISSDPHVRVGVLRSGIRHLEAGGALLIFPSGHIDPDPEILPGSQDALRHWSPSVELMLRRVPETQILVTIVSGVLAAVCVRSPLTRIRREAVDRQRIAEFIQVIQQMVFDRKFALRPRVSFAEPVTVAQLRGVIGASGVREALIERALHLLVQHTTLGLSQATPS